MNDENASRRMPLDADMDDIAEYVRTGYAERGELREKVAMLTQRTDEIDAGQSFLIDQLDRNTRLTMETVAAVERNTQMTTANATMAADIQKNTAEIVAIANALKGFAKVCGWIGAALRRLAWVIAPGGILFAVYTATRDFMNKIGKG